MKQFIIKNPGIDSIAYVSTPRPSIGDHQVLIKVKAVSLNFRDIIMANGIRGIEQKYPYIPCSDSAGVVVKVGKNVKHFKSGDKVVNCYFKNYKDGQLIVSERYNIWGGPYMDGVLAEYIAADEEGIVHMPPTLSFIEASTLPNAYLTAWNALFVHGVTHPNMTVVILGTGGVAIAALQLAKLSGCSVIITSSSDDKLQRAKDLGADYGVNYVKHVEWDQEIRKIMPDGVDIVIELGGTLKQSANVVKSGGRIALIGSMSDSQSFPNLDNLLDFNITMHGTSVGSKASFLMMNKALNHNAVKPVIDEVFDFKDSIKALNYLSQDVHFGKTCINIDQT